MNKLAAEPQSRQGAVFGKLAVLVVGVVLVLGVLALVGRPSWSASAAAPEPVDRQASTS